VAKPEGSVRVRAPMERIIPPANKKGATKSRKDDMFQSNRVINGENLILKKYFTPHKNNNVE
jgi:hypothetical protein